ncbi:Polyneuridine-aldehyde esterase [Linum perenne]
MEKAAAAGNNNKQHFVLVHGAAHGAWCWYKLIPLLKSNGHRVTALDLGACGTNPKQLDEIYTISDYAEPLMEFMAALSGDERVVLVAHSFGGYIISLAMEKFEKKVVVAVYVTALMPDLVHPPAGLMIELLEATPEEVMTQCKVKFDKEEANLPISASFSSTYLETLMYTNCQPEQSFMIICYWNLQDLELAKLMLRPFKFFLKDLSSESLLSEAKFGSVKRVYIVCKEDVVMSQEFQERVIQSYPPDEVKYIEDADHMAMLSKPEQLCKCLLEVAGEDWLQG